MKQQQRNPQQQLALPLKLSQSASFAEFVSGENQELCQRLQNLWQHETEIPEKQAGLEEGYGNCVNNQKFIYLWGRSGVGKSHLLYASNELASARGKSAFYLDLTDAPALQAGIFHGLENYDLVCLDNLQAIMGNSAKCAFGHASEQVSQPGTPFWEESLFHLYNRIQTRQCCLLVAANSAPADLPCVLGDLHSRLSAGVTYQVRGLSDEDKMCALRSHASRQGIPLNVEVAQFIVRHFARDMPGLLGVLHKLAEHSLIAQRRITIPFIRESMRS